MCVHVHMCVHAHVYVNVHAYMCVYVCVLGMGQYSIVSWKGNIQLDSIIIGRI